MHDCQSVAENGFIYTQCLRSKSDFGQQDDCAPIFGKTFFAGFNNDLCLSASGHAEKQCRLCFTAVHKFRNSRKHIFLFVGQLIIPVFFIAERSQRVTVNTHGITFYHIVFFKRCEY